jgi:hypothetical protein
MLMEGSDEQVEVGYWMKHREGVFGQLVKGGLGIKYRSG